MSMRSQKWLLGVASSVLLTVSAAHADQASPVYHLPSGLAAAPIIEQSGTGYSVTTTPRRHAFSRIGRLLDRHPATRRTIVGVGGAFGVVVDYSRGLPRVRGLALSPNDALTLEASGRIATGFDNVSGQLSLHLSF